MNFEARGRSDVNFFPDLQVRRVWLSAALALFLGVACANEAVIPADSPRASDVRVDVQWRLDLASDRAWELDPREMGQPVLSPGGDLLVGASNGWVYRIRAHSGQIVWGSEIGGSIDASAKLVGRTVYVGTDAGYLVSLDWTDGEEQWRTETRGSVETRPTVADGRVFVTDSNDVLYALDAASGEPLWDFQHQTPDFFTLKGGGEPLVIDDVVYCGFADGRLTALHTDVGEEIWTVDLGHDVDEFGDIDVPLFSDEDRLIAISHSGGIYALERQTGATLWHADITGVVGAEKHEHWLFGAAATGMVFALDTREGEVYWDYELADQDATVDVSVAGPFVAVAVSDGPMYWLHLRSGEPAAKWAPSTGFQNAPIFDDRYGYVMSNRGYLYGFGLAF